MQTDIQYFAKLYVNFNIYILHTTQQQHVRNLPLEKPISNSIIDITI